MEKFNEHHCIKCNYSVYENVVTYCKKQLHGFILCKKCQDWYKSDVQGITPESKKFYLALRLRGVNVELEKDDGHKHIDLAITGKGLKLNIEVDGLPTLHLPEAKLVGYPTHVPFFAKGVLYPAAAERACPGAVGRDRRPNRGPAERFQGEGNPRLQTEEPAGAAIEAVVQGRRAVGETGNYRYLNKLDTIKPAV